MKEKGQKNNNQAKEKTRAKKNNNQAKEKTLIPAEEAVTKQCPQRQKSKCQLWGSYYLC